MRDRSRSDPQSRFAIAIKSSISGHSPHADYRHAASLRRAEGWSEETMSKAVLDWLQTDLNPAVQSIRAARSRAAVIGLYNIYNESVQLGVRTAVEAGSVRRSLVNVERDDELCAAGSLAVLRWIHSDAEAKLKRPSSEWMLTAWNSAVYLGAERQASAEAVRILEIDGDKDLRTLAACLGSSARTLQRQIAIEGLTVTELRLACRQSAALRMIQEGRQSLGQIASVAGFADQAHMSRSFKSASGLTPGQIARMLGA
ncbi:MAG: AraC family transcriptional regulator [Rubrivivax sp.]